MSTPQDNFDYSSSSSDDEEHDLDSAQAGAKLKMTELLSAAKNGKVRVDLDGNVTLHSRKRNKSILRHGFDDIVMISQSMGQTMSATALATGALLDQVKDESKPSTTSSPQTQIQDSKQDGNAEHGTEQKSSDAADDPTAEQRAFQLATVYVMDSSGGFDWQHRTDTISLTVIRIVRSVLLRGFVWLLLLVLFALTIFEYPAAVEIPLGITQGVELFILLLLCFEAITYIIVNTQQSIFIARNAQHAATLLIAVAMLVDITVNLAFRGQTVRITRILRCYFVIARHASLSTTIKHILICMWQMLELIAALVLFIGSYSALGYLIMKPVPGDLYFRTFFESFFNMSALLFGSVNFPDVMLPSFRFSPAYAIYFVVYLVVGLYMILNLLLAMVYTIYRRSVQKTAVRNFKMRREAIMAAFRALDIEKRGYIQWERFKKFFLQLRFGSNVKQAKAIFAQVDTDGNNQLEAADFIQLVDALGMGVRRRRAWFPQALRPLREAFRRPLIPKFRAFVESEFHYAVVTICVLLSAGADIVSISQTQQDYAWWGQLIFHLLDCIVLLIFVSEVVCSILAYGFNKYFFGRWWRKLDFAVVVLLVLEKIILEFILAYALPEALTAHDSYFRRVVVFIRMFSFLRILCANKRLRIMAESWVGTVMLIFGFLAALVLWLYMFSIIGMAIFNGKLVPDNHALDGTDYNALNYYSLNFNQWPRGMLLLFHLLILNNWHVSTRALMAVTTDGAVAYFYIFYFGCITILLNVVLPFFVEAFSFKFSETETEINAAVAREKAARTRKPRKLKSFRHKQAQPATSNEQVTLASPSSPETSVQNIELSVESAFSLLSKAMGGGAAALTTVQVEDEVDEEDNDIILQKQRMAMSSMNMMEQLYADANTQKEIIEGQVAAATVTPSTPTAQSSSALLQSHPSIGVNNQQ